MKLLTPPGLAGVAVLRVEPGERADVLACLQLADGRPCAPSPGRPPQRAALRIDGRDVDDVLVVARADGALELHTHGSPAVLDQIAARFDLEVAPAATPAERLLREALSDQQFDLAAEQCGYDFDAELAALAAMPPAARRAAVDAARARSELALALAVPQRVALVGRQNAGKSTLFNLLLFRERALTGDTPGLTRDPIAETTTLAGYPYELIDTAGEGAAPTALDAAAIELGRAQRDGALLVAVVDGGVGPHPDDRELFARCALLVRSKDDLAPAPWPDELRCDASFSAQRQSPQQVRDELGQLLAAVRGLPAAAPVGGFCALDEAQLRRLNAIDVDGPAAPPPA
jgi:small GTP-binding protein